MYKNYGDVNFFERGRLVKVYQDEHGNIETNQAINILYCEPLQDGTEKYLFADCFIDPSDNWIKTDDLMSYTGYYYTEYAEDQIYKAIDTIEYYGIENFSTPYAGYIHNYDYIVSFLESRDIDTSDFFNVFE